MKRLIWSLALTPMLACGASPTAPTGATTQAATARTGAALANQGNGPETPPFNLQAVLRPTGAGGGFGLVKFRQPNDDQRRIFLDTWVRDLAADSSYYLERAVDSTLDDVCTGSSWLRLGLGTTVQPLVTDAAGTGRAEFFRDLPASLVAQRYDIHFRIVSASGAPVLQSGCHQYVVEPD